MPKEMKKSDKWIYMRNTFTSKFKSDGYINLTPEFLGFDSIQQITLETIDKN